MISLNETFSQNTITKSSQISSNFFFHFFWNFSISILHFSNIFSSSALSFNFLSGMLIFRLISGINLIRQFLVFEYIISYFI